MTQSPRPDTGVTDDEVLLAFTVRYTADRNEGRATPLIDYLGIWRDHQAAVAREYLAAEAAQGAGPGALGLAPAPAGSEQLGPYVIEREIGRGGQGAVYLAEDTRLHRKVALKVLHGLGPGAETNLHRFRREAEAASRLNHPGICGVHDAGVQGGVPYIAMPFVEGATLSAWIGARLSVTGGTAPEVYIDLDSTSGWTGVEDGSPATDVQRATLTRTDIFELLRIFEKAASALHAAHEAGILHRDIKPGNIMVTKAGQPVILDFGLARLEDDQGDAPSLTRSGDVFGTPAYMSPEQIAGTRIKLDRRSDVYSLGVSLYECLTLRCPFEEATRQALYQAILSKTPIDPRKHNRSIPRDLRTVVETAIEKDRDRRYVSADALAHDLRAVIEGRPIQARPVGPIGRLVRWSKREPAKAALLLVILVAFPTIATLVTSHVKDRPQVEAARLARFEQAKDELLSEASFEVTEGDARKAVALYTQVFEMEGRSPEAAGGMVLASLKLGNPSEALRLLDLHRGLLGEGAAADHLRAGALWDLGQKEEAEALLAAAPHPRSAFEHHLLAQEQLQKGEAGDTAAFGRALRHVTAAILLSPAPRLSLFTLRAHAAGHAKNPEAAVETAAGLQCRWGDSVSAQYWRGFALLSVEDPTLVDDAITAFREAIRLKPGYADAYGNLGEALRLRGLLDDALLVLREAIRLNPRNVAAHDSMARAFNDKGSLDDSVAAFREAIRLKPGDAGLRKELGTMLAKQERFDDAIAAFRESIRLNPGDASALNNLAVALERTGDVDGAIAILREAIGRHPGDADLHYNLGTELEGQGLLDDAIASFREAIRLNRALREAYTSLGYALRKKGRLDDAIAVLREAIRLRPDDATAHTVLGDFLNNMGLSEDAIAAHREAIRLKPDEFVAHVNLAVALNGRGLLDDAIAACREAIRLKPDRPEAHYNLGKSLEDQGFLDDAMAAYREAIRLKPDFAQAHCNLGSILSEVGPFHDSLVALRRGHELGSQQPGWSYPSEEWVAEAERLVSADAGIEARLAGHLAAGTEPRGARELIVLARVALDQGHHALAARWYRNALEEVPTLAERLAEGPQRRAARAAMQTSTARRDAAADPDDTEGMAWRLQALTWLEAEVSDIRDAGKEGELAARQARIALVPLALSPDFAPVRENETLARLPDAERKRWTKLWADVEALLQALDEGGQ